MVRSILGFGDEDGGYDFDTLSIQTPKQRSNSKSSPLIGGPHVFSHELNHWRQQTTTSFGNFTTLCRVAIFDETHWIWSYLDEKIRGELLNGNQRGIFSGILDNGFLDPKFKDLLPDHIFSEIDICGRRIHVLSKLEELYSNPHWLFDEDIRDANLNVIYLGHLILDDFTSNYPELERTQHSAKYVSRTGEFLKEIPFLQNELHHAVSIMEASCIAQECHMYALYKDIGYMIDRLNALSGSHYLAPIVEILNILSLDLNFENIVSHAGLITSVAELALNPPIPPRGDIGDERCTLADIHPSIRFHQIAISLPSLTKISRNNFNFFSIDKPGQWSSDLEKGFSEIRDSYLSGVEKLSAISGVSSIDRSQESYLFPYEIADKKGTYIQSITSLRKCVEASFEGLPQKKFTDSANELLNNYPYLILLILDVCYNSVANGSCVLQNSMMMPSSYFQKIRHMYDDIPNLITSDFENVLTHLIPMDPLQVFNDPKEGNITTHPILRHLLPVTSGMLQSGLSQYYLLFCDDDDIRFNNFEYDNKDVFGVEDAIRKAL